MILNEAIERYTSNAEYERIHGNLQGCLDFRQLAEWLKDYKRLLKQEPKAGHWIRVTDNSGHLVWECDKCGWQQRFNANFCPDCGAKMK